MLSAAQIATRLTFAAQAVSPSQEPEWHWATNHDSYSNSFPRRQMNWITVGSVAQFIEQRESLLSFISGNIGVRPSMAWRWHTNHFADNLGAFFGQNTFSKDDVAIVWTKSCTQTAKSQFGKLADRGKPTVFPVDAFPSSFKLSPVMRHAINARQRIFFASRNPKARLYLLREPWHIKVGSSKCLLRVDSIVQSDCDPVKLRSLQKSGLHREAARLVLGLGTSEIVDAPMVGLGVILPRSRDMYYGMSVSLTRGAGELIRISNHAVFFDVAWCRFQHIGFAEVLDEIARTATSAHLV